MNQTTLFTLKIAFKDCIMSNIHFGLYFKWFHETLYIFVSYTKEFPDFMTVTLSFFFLANFEIFSRFQNKLKLFLQLGPLLYKKQKLRQILRQNGSSRGVMRYELSIKASSRNPI